MAEVAGPFVAAARAGLGQHGRPMTTIAILLFEGVEELDFAGPWEVFRRRPSEDPTFDVFTVAETSSRSPARTACACWPTARSPTPAGPT